jgi:hypothetical protein
VSAVYYGLPGPCGTEREIIDAIGLPNWPAEASYARLLDLDQHAGQTQRTLKRIAD